MKSNHVPRTQHRTVHLAQIAVGAALMAICAWLAVPLTVPITLQTFAVCFILAALGGKRGTCAILVYILLGAIGMPVFAHFTGGIGTLLGSTGGYILGFLLVGIVYLIMTKLFGNRLAVQSIALLLGLLLCYLSGTAWYIFVCAKAISLHTALTYCVFPFILPDLIQLGLALVIARRIQPML